VKISDTINSISNDNATTMLMVLSSCHCRSLLVWSVTSPNSARFIPCLHDQANIKQT